MTYDIRFRAKNKKTGEWFYWSLKDTFDTSWQTMVAHEVEIDWGTVEEVLSAPSGESKPSWMRKVEAYTPLGAGQAHIIAHVMMAIAEAEQRVRDKIIKDYGHFNDGCGCCGQKSLKEELNIKEVTNE